MSKPTQSGKIVPYMTRAAQAVGSFFSTVTKVTGKLLGKIICILDDIPFLIKGVLPENLKSLGSFMLAGAGFLAFPVEMKEGIQGLIKAVKLKKTDPRRKTLIASNLTKIGLSAGGIGVSVALLCATIMALGVAEPILSLLIPVTMALITGVEFWQKLSAYRIAKQMPAGAERDEAIAKAKRSLIFSSIYLALSTAIVALALLGTLAALGAATFGIAPVAALVGVVCVALAVKIFQLVDKKYNYKFTNGIKDFFENIFNKVFGKKKKQEHKQEHDQQSVPSSTPAPAHSTYGRMLDIGLVDPQSAVTPVVPSAAQTSAKSLWVSARASTNIVRDPELALAGPRRL